MSFTAIKNKVLQEIDLIPEDKLTDLYNFIHYFRLGLEKSHQEKSNPNLAFAGSWKDMPDDVFDDFMADIAQRRQQAFSRRREDEGFTG